MKLVFLLFFTIIILTSCDTDDNRCFKSNGDIVTEETTTNYFDKVKIQSDFEVHLENSNESSITITAGKNLIPYIEYNITNNELSINDKNGCEWLRERIKPVITLKSPSFETIIIEQACDLKTNDTLKFDNLSLETWAGIFSCDMNLEGDSLFFRCHATTGDYNIFGDCNYAYFYNIGNGYLKASRFYCDFIHIVHSSLGESKINASEQIILEKIEYGTVTSFSNQCPQIVTWGNDWGDLFINFGCQD